MELSKEEFKVIVAGLKNYFPQENFLPTGQAAALWYERLKDIPYDILQAAVHMHVESSTFPPTIFELRMKASRLSATMQAQFPETEEVIAMLEKATQRASYYADEEFEKLPKVVQRLVGSPNGLRSFAAMDEDEVKQILTNRVSKQYEAIVKREREEARYTPPIKDLIASVDKMAEVAKLTGETKPLDMEKLTSGNVGLNQIRAKEGSPIAIRLPADAARERFEGLEDYAPPEDEYTNTLKLRFGATAPRKE